MVPLSTSQAHMSKSIKQMKLAVKWSDIVIGRKDNCCVPNGVLACSIPTTINGQVSSPVYNGDKDCKILLLSDSHGRECAKRIKDCLPKNFEVCGCVKPGMRMDTLFKTAPLEIMDMTKNDVTVVWCGSNDIARNNSSTGLRNIQQFIRNNIHTNIIVVSVRQRYHLSPLSCINNEVLSFNRKLEKIIKPFSHVSLINIVCYRENFTKHGLHLNKSGKWIVSTQITKYINTIIQNEIVQFIKPIQLGWKCNPVVCNVDDDVNLGKAVNDSTIINAENDKEQASSSIRMITQTSTRIRRVPAMKTDDFLW
jgi:hypothetical protein